VYPGNVLVDVEQIQLKVITSPILNPARRLMLKVAVIAAFYADDGNQH
jgi:hypothetical protein